MKQKKDDRFDFSTAGKLSVNNDEAYTVLGLSWNAVMELDGPNKHPGYKKEVAAAFSEQISRLEKDKSGRVKTPPLVDVMYYHLNVAFLPGTMSTEKRKDYQKSVIRHCNEAVSDICKKGLKQSVLNFDKKEFVSMAMNRKIHQENHRHSNTFFEPTDTKVQTNQNRGITLMKNFGKLIAQHNQRTEKERQENQNVSFFDHKKGVGKVLKR